MTVKPAPQPNTQNSKTPSSGRARESFWRTCNQLSTPHWSVDSVHSATGNGFNQGGKFTPPRLQTRFVKLTPYARCAESTKNSHERHDNIARLWTHIVSHHSVQHFRDIDRSTLSTSRQWIKYISDAKSNSAPINEIARPKKRDLKIRLAAHSASLTSENSNDCNIELKQ